MPDGDGPGPHGRGDPGQEGIAHPPGGVFQRPPALRGHGGHVRPAHGAGHIPGGAGRGHKRGVGGGLGAQAMVEMGDVDAQPGLRRKVHQRVQQGQGVGAARYAGHQRPGLGHACGARRLPECAQGRQECTHYLFIIPDGAAGNVEMAHRQVVAGGLSMEKSMPRLAAGRGLRGPDWPTVGRYFAGWARRCPNCRHRSAGPDRGCGRPCAVR